MNTRHDNFNVGDSCFLFTHFPLNYHSISPYEQAMQILPGVHLIQTPSHILANPQIPHYTKQQNAALAEWICPGFHFPGSASNVSIKIDASIDAKKVNLLFWATIGLLYLIKPLFIGIGGKFTYGNFSTGLIAEPERIDLRSNLFLMQPPHQAQEAKWLRYSKEDFELSRKIFQRFFEILNNPHNNRRQFYNVLAFMRAFIYEKSHFNSSIFTMLFPLLDSLSANPSYMQGAIVSERLGSFLANIPFNQKGGYSSQEEITKRLKHIWELHRYPELHGHIKEEYDITPETQPLEKNNAFLSDKEDLNDLRDLAEIARVALLKTFLLNQTTEEAYLQIPIPATGKSLKEAKDINKDRDKKAEEFFNTQHANAPELIFYTDFLLNSTKTKD